MIALLGLLSALLFCTSAWLLLQRVRAGTDSRLWLPVAAAAVLCAGWFVAGIVIAPGGLRLGIAEVAALIGFSVATLLTLASLRSITANLGMLLYPLTALTVLWALLAPQAEIHAIASPGLRGHVLSSLLAYSLLSIAAAQAVFLALQEYRLRRHRASGLLAALPPLQTMEVWLFQLIAAGFLLLSVSLGSGLLFVDDPFAQHLLHKMVFSIAAWLVFAALMWGRWRHGWRGRRAIRWTLAGFVLLLLAYFGTRWVLETLLHQQWG